MKSLNVFGWCISIFSKKIEMYYSTTTTMGLYRLMGVCGRFNLVHPFNLVCGQRMLCMQDGQIRVIEQIERTGLFSFKLFSNGKLVDQIPRVYQHNDNWPDWHWAPQLVSHGGGKYSWEVGTFYPGEVITSGVFDWHVVKHQDNIISLNAFAQHDINYGKYTLLQYVPVSVDNTD